MNKSVIGILLCLLFLAPLSRAQTEDPLTKEERTWISRHGTIRVGMSHYYPPFVFVDKIGQPQGMAIFKLADGDAEAIILDEPVVNYFVKEYDLQKKIQRIGEPVDEGRMSLPVLKGNKILLDILNKGVDMVTKTEWEEIENRWFGESKEEP